MRTRLKFCAQAFLRGPWAGLWWAAAGPFHPGSMCCPSGEREPSPPGACCRSAGTEDLESNTYSACQNTDNWEPDQPAGVSVLVHFDTWFWKGALLTVRAQFLTTCWISSSGQTPGFMEINSALCSPVRVSQAPMGSHYTDMFEMEIKNVTVKHPTHKGKLPCLERQQNICWKDLPKR